VGFVFPQESGQAVKLQSDGNARGVTAEAFTVSSSGNTILVTPPAGKNVRVYYVAYSADPANSAAVVAFLRFAVAGAAKYKVGLLAGAIYARNIGAGRYHQEGNVDESLVVNLSAAQTVHVSLEYEFVPIQTV
jgi:hypothetical protein